MITEKERVTIRYGYKIEATENYRFFSRFINGIEKVKKTGNKKKKRNFFIKLWNSADCSSDADFYFAFLKLHLPEFYK